MGEEKERASWEAKKGEEEKLKEMKGKSWIIELIAVKETKQEGRVKKKIGSNRVKEQSWRMMGKMGWKE